MDTFLLFLFRFLEFLSIPWAIKVRELNAEDAPIDMVPLNVAWPLPQAIAWTCILRGIIIDDEFLRADMQGNFSFAPVAKPRYVHDCDVCKFMGHEGVLDVYECPHSFETGKVYRWGDHPWQYSTLKEYALAESQNPTIDYGDPCQICSYRATCDGSQCFPGD